MNLLRDNDDLLAADLTDETAESETESTSEGESSAEPISRFGLLSEELSGGAGAMYLREIAHHELLTAAEEISLAQRLEAGKQAMKELATDEDALDPERRAELEHLAEDG